MDPDLEHTLRLRKLYLNQMEQHAKDENPLEFMYWTVKHIEAFKKCLELEKEKKGAKGNEERIFEGLDRSVQRNKRPRKKR